MALDLNKRVISTLEVVAPNVIHSHPGGTYNLNEDNHTEERVVKLHILGHFIDLMTESYCDSAENNILLGEEVDRLADKLYGYFDKFIRNGVNIFEYYQYYNAAELAKYHNRPIVGRKMNLAEGEQHGVPKGWAYDFPGQMSKYFPIGKVVIDFEDPTYRVGIYDQDDEDGQPFDWLELITIGDIDDIYSKYPELGPEVVDAIRAMRNLCKI